MAKSPAALHREAADTELLMMSIEPGLCNLGDVAGAVAGSRGSALSCVLGRCWHWLSSGH